MLSMFGQVWTDLRLSDKLKPSPSQGTKRFRSNSLGLVDFVAGLVEFILHLFDGQVKVFGEIFL